MIGIDGTPDGWVTARYTGQTWELYHIDRLAQLPDEPALIDIPLGLPEDTERACDAAARSFLAPERHQSVFNCPVRDAVYANSYEAACDRNEVLTGKRISIQAWNIVPKIREADQIDHHSLQESHPEVVFKALAPTSVSASKTTANGQQARRSVLEQFGDTSVIDSFTDRTATIDDTIDAMVLAVCSQFECRAVGNTDQIAPDGTPMQILRPVVHDDDRFYQSS